MNWPDFYRAVLAEFEGFAVPEIHERLAELDETDVWGGIVHLDTVHKKSVDKIVRHFAKTKTWQIASDDERILIWLRLNFVRETVAFLALGMSTLERKWTPFNATLRIHDEADDASLWTWFLIDAWHFSGLTQISGILQCVAHLRHGAPSK